MRSAGNPFTELDRFADRPRGRGSALGKIALSLLCGILLLIGCKGKSPTTPSTPNNPTTPSPAPIADPLVTIQVTYSCHPCTNDPDNYAINIDCGNNRCGAMVRAQNPTLEHNTLTFTGRLTPGAHNMEVVVQNVETSVVIAFPASAAGTSTGGIKPDSLRQQNSLTSAVEINTFNRCGSVTTFRTRPTSRYETFFTFDVILGAAAAVC